MNLTEYLNEFRSSIDGQEKAEEVGVVDVCRDPLKKFADTVSIGYVRTFRCNNSSLWVLPSLALADRLGDRGRFLSREEKARIAGFRPSSLASLTDKEMEVAIGNSIPVSLIGVIMHPVLRAWIEVTSA